MGDGAGAGEATAGEAFGEGAAPGAAPDGDGAAGEGAVHAQRAVPDGGGAGVGVGAGEGERAGADLDQRHRAGERAGAGEGVVAGRIHGDLGGLERAGEGDGRLVVAREVEAHGLAGGEGGGGGGGALGPELEPPCGPSEARATVGTANVSNAIRHRLDTATLSFFISILLVFSPQ